MNRVFPILSIVAALVGVAFVRADQAYVASEVSGGHLWRIEDVNGDGDGLDVGERTLWGDGFTLSWGMTVDSGAVYVTEAGLGSGNNRILRLSDANRDGDALDFGERTIWADGLDSPRDISYDGASAWYVSELNNNQIWRLVDSDYDGDALDAGEKTLFAAGISQPQWILPQAGSLFVASTTDHQVHRLTDSNGDGDALDVGENLIALTASNIELVGLLDDGGGGFFVSSYLAHTVYQARDTNGDGDMLDVAEFLSYADSVYGLIDGPTGLATMDGGGFLLADLANGQLRLVHDANGDGDALDLGDVHLYADGISQPGDVAILPFILPGDYNVDGMVNAADYTVWRNNFGQHAGSLPNDTVGGTIDIDQFNLWKANYGESKPTGSGAITNTNVPEPTSVAQLAIELFVLLGSRFNYIKQRRP